MAADRGEATVSSLLHEVASRLGPRVPLCPVDFSCPFTVCDLSQPHCPIVDVSRPFEVLTGYARHQILGRNCRFLQHPEGREDIESRQHYTDLSVVGLVKTAILSRSEIQVCLINYRKDGHPFVNLLTVIPVGNHYALGFQIDAVDSPTALDTASVRPFAQEPGSLHIDYRTAPSIPAAIQQSAIDDLGALIEQTSLANADSNDDAWRIEDFYAYHVAGDVVFALSSKATVAYVSPSSSAFLGFLPAELIRTSFSALCHPSDVIDLFRTFAGGAPSGSFNVAFRMRSKSRGYKWVDATVKPARDSESGISYTLVVLRKHDTVPLAPESTSSDCDMAWAKVTPTGLILHMSFSIKDILLKRANELQGTSIHDLSSTNPAADLAPALQEASSGKSVTCSHLFIDKRNRRIPVMVTLDPGELVAPDYGTPRRASFVVVRISHDKTDSIKAYLARDHEAENSTAESIAMQIRSDMPPMTAPRAWANELRALEAANNELARQLSQMMALRRRRRRREHAAGPCQQCGRTETPEWRRGPSGANTLCNSCGIKWAKRGDAGFSSRGFGFTQAARESAGSISAGSQSPGVEAESLSAASSAVSMSPEAVVPGKTLASPTSGQVPEL